MREILSLSQRAAGNASCIEVVIADPAFQEFGSALAMAPFSLSNSPETSLSCDHAIEPGSSRQASSSIPVHVLVDETCVRANDHCPQKSNQRTRG